MLFRSHSLKERKVFEFIKFLEFSSSVHILDKWMIEKALIMLGANEYISLSVNVSAQSICREEFLLWLVELLDGVSFRGRLQFEITETERLAEGDLVESFFKIIKAHGYSIAMDDFGVGYSNIEALDCFDYDVVKIDKSIIQTMNQDKMSRQVIQELLSHPQKANLELVAEGVDSKELSDNLLEMGIKYGQSFYLMQLCNKVDIG